MTLVPFLLLGTAALPDAALIGDSLENYRETVTYDLEARLDPAEKTVTGKGTIRWTNRGDRPVRELWWHLYLNAFKNDRSTFMRESDGGKLRGDVFERGAWGYIDVTQLESRGADLLASRTFEQPDDGNEADRTVMRTPLPFAVGPGEQVELSVAFTSKLPRVFARSGYGGTFFMVAQWFPKLGVLEDSYREGLEVGTSSPAWNCHQYHAHSEYFADYGRFEVAITVPADHVVGATGKRVAEKKNDDGTVTYVHEQARVHDFSFTADPRFIEKHRTFDPVVEVTAAQRKEAADLLNLPVDAFPITPVEVKLLVQPEHEQYADRYFRAVFESLRWFGLWYGAYPYEVLTVVDGPRTARGAMGMEYPTLITGGVSWPAPESVASPEGVTVHEFGHQYWYGLVGSNEFEESWLDEGFNTYSTGKVLDRAYGAFVIAPKALGIRLVPWFPGTKIDQLGWARMGTMLSPTSDAIARTSWGFRDGTSYGVNSYPRTALTLRQLEHELGPSAFARALRAYHLRYRYRHPTTRDFISVVEEAAGHSMDHFFEPAMYRSVKFDYAVDELTSKKRPTAAGRFDEDKTVTIEEAEALDEENEDRPFDTEVYVRREGGAQHPVTLEVAFEDGRTERVTWDGRYRWKRFRFTTDAKALHARLHPDGEMPIDLDRGNDSRTVESSRLPGASWGAHVLYTVQTLWQVLGGLL